LLESRAICCYIDHAFAGPPLTPRDPVNGARVEQWISIVNTHIDPVVMRRYIRSYVFPDTSDGSPDRVTINAALQEMEERLTVLDRAVTKTGHLVGNSFTLADINLLPILFYLDKAPESGAMLRGLTSLKTYLDRHLARPSVRETIPPRFPGRSGYVVADA
jgi:glutathione S-transferase